MKLIRPMVRRSALPILIFVITASVYVGTLGDRMRGPSPDNHFVHLANSFLHGQLSVVGNNPPGNNDWAKYKNRWYVSFPPFPAVILIPAVATWGTQVWDRLFWAIFAGLGPAFVYFLLRYLRESGLSGRSIKEDLLLTSLFAFGSVYYFTSVQGTTWFAAHVVSCPIMALYVFWSLDGRRPILAGLMLGLCLMTRTATLFAFVFFIIEALRVAQADTTLDLDADMGPLKKTFKWLSHVKWRSALPPLLLFSIPILMLGSIMMWMNYVRFDDPLVFGHSHLQIKWRYRMDKWGLFNYHYFSRNLAIFLAALPWISSTAPFIKISRHGLAIWYTTPHVLMTLWPKRVSTTMVGLYISTLIMIIVTLFYHNSGWIQFGYRFSLDYMVLLIALLALGRRRFGLGFYLLLIFAFWVNFFGAVTFDRVPIYYDTDLSQQMIFQPD